ncbi:MAG: cyclic nucleotide-binding domain-containing protein [Anaerolineae bacterium]|nr:cyclic nucleotide-binding domain-containing protein [Anaerolineae bacterium]
MNGSDDPLDGLLDSVRRRRKQDQVPASGTPGQAETTGLNPLDLLALPHAQRDLVNWLSRQKQARFEQIQAALGVDAAQIESVLADLKQAGYIHEALIDGEIYYRVVFRGKVSRGGRSLPDSIWARVDLDTTEFLRQIPLFRALSDEEIHVFADKLEARRYHRNEVILWQGGMGEGVYFIKIGIVGITRLSPNTRDTQILDYLKQGDLLGEYNLLSEQCAVASATATALSEVDVLLMAQDDFIYLLENHHKAAIELARMLLQRLLAASERLSSRGTSNTLSLVIGVEPGVGCTTLGNALAMTLPRTTQGTAVYTEYPSPDNLQTLFNFELLSEVFEHPGGYDVMTPRVVSGVPAAVHMTLVMDRLVGHYASVVIGLPGGLDDSVIYMLERADQVVIVTPPGSQAQARLDNLVTHLKKLIRPEKTGLVVVCNCSTPAQADMPPPKEAELVIPFVDGLLPLPEWTGDNLPPALADVAGALADRLGRTNQIGIYIPTTIDVDKPLDTSRYVDETLAFLGKLFGGATSNQAQGVWNSETVGLVSETVYVVRTYITKADMDRHLSEVLAFAERLKHELRQEAMALEVNQKLMLI